MNGELIIAEQSSLARFPPLSTQRYAAVVSELTDGVGR